MFVRRTGRFTEKPATRTVTRKSHLRSTSLQEKEALDPEVLEFLSKADAFGQDVFKDVIRQIQFSEPVFDEGTVARWVREGRFVEKHGALFRQLTAANKPIEPPHGAADEDH